MEQGPEGESSDASRELREAQDHVAEARRVLQLASSGPQPADSFDSRFREIRLKRRESDTKLAGAMGWSTLALFVGQALIVDAAFLTYAAEIEWKLPEGVIIAWLGAGVIQLIGSVALVIARYLFPDGGPGEESSEN